jgi:hypothetical protein
MGACPRSWAFALCGLLKGCMVAASKLSWCCVCVCMFVSIRCVCVCVRGIPLNFRKGPALTLPLCHAQNDDDYYGFI